MPWTDQITEIALHVHTFFWVTILYKFHDHFYLYSDTVNNELTDQDQTVDRADTEENDQYEADDNSAYVDEIVATDLMYDYNEVREAAKKSKKIRKKRI